jgi:hypothetical protein
MSGSTGAADTFSFYGRLMSIRVSTPARSSAGEAPVASGRIRALGLVCAVGGLLGAASVVPMLAVPPMVGPDRFSYPFDAGWHIAAEVFLPCSTSPCWPGSWVWRRTAVGTGLGWSVPVSSSPGWVWSL